MAGDSSEGSMRELYDTPTWAVALICGVMIIISLLLEKGLHLIGEVCVNYHGPMKTLFALPKLN
jgi:Mlo family